MNNKIELLGFYGSDEVIACSALTSTSRNLTEEKRARIPKMIADLWANGHKTPFEKGVVHFLVDSDIASHIHFLKHRISSINAESARYKELKEDKSYLPPDWKDIPILDDSGQNISIPFNGEIISTWYDLLKASSDNMNVLYHWALRDVEKVLGRKRAKESARYFKMYNSQIEGDIMFNMSSFANFLKLRDSDKAQKEIKDIAHAMAETVLNIEGNPFKETMKAFGYENI